MLVIYVDYLILQIVVMTPRQKKGKKPMARLSKKHLETRLDYLNRYLAGKNWIDRDVANFAIDYSYGGARMVYRKVNGGAESDVSIRGTKSEIGDIISAIENVVVRFNKHTLGRSS